MAETGSRWRRAHFRPGGGDAFVLYAVFGDFAEPFHLSRTKYRSSGVPDGVKVSHFTRDAQPAVFETFTSGYFGKLLEAQPELDKQVQAAAQMVLIRGVVQDPPTLDYLRDVIGLVACLFDSGGVALKDSQMLRWWSPEEWHESIFEPDEPQPHKHTVILVSDEQTPDNTVWFHTRGLRKFGRPDISVRGVNPAYQDVAAELCNRLIQLQAAGHIIPEGQQLQMNGLPKGMRCRHRGTHDDPEFNNIHVEVEWPGK